MLNDFSYATYVEILKKLGSTRKNLTFSDFSKGSRTPESYFILRHDIDFSLESALEMANIEADNGIKATYFLLLSCDLYNLQTIANRKTPRELVAMGHEVGVHYDVQALHATNAEDLYKGLLHEIETMSLLSGEPVLSVAMHNPSIYGEDPFSEFGHFINAYDACFTKEIAYFSDSCGAWRNDFHHLYSTARLPDKLQLLVHPLFWSQEGKNRWSRLEEFEGQKQSLLKEDCLILKDIWENHSGVKEHDDRMKKSN